MKAVVFLADGFEACEALITVDILRRAGVETIMASVSGRPEAESSRGIWIRTDLPAEDVDFGSVDMIVLPGGRTGTENMAAKSKVYAVKKGRTPGLYLTWEDCKAQVDGFPGAEYKSFSDAEEAMAYLGISGSSGETAFPEGVRAYVDGSYDAASGRFSCGVVMIRTDAEGNVRTRELSEAFDDPEAAKQRNVAGEIMGAKTAIDFCLRQGIDEVSIYHDYEGIGKWADGKWKANNALTQGYRDYVAKARTRMKISFVKVKAHAGNKYNELADRLAKDALSAD